MSLFVAGLSRLSSKQGRVAMLIGDMDISRLMVYVQQVKEEKLRDREKKRGPVPSSASAPAPRYKREFTGQNSQNFRVGPAQSQNSVAQGRNQVLACARCGRVHPGKCRQGQTGCFKCGQEDHFMKECPKNKQVGLHLMTMETQVSRVSIQYTVNPAEHSREYHKSNEAYHKEVADGNSEEEEYYKSLSRLMRKTGMMIQEAFNE
ncbi:uncharacterized protein LOC125832791 [Solanum verrucosum]|uniref:uncharacterized protein LOC125832791 n=1 Tax=Solanum verrucosum TaxID=315347 RepID=UPI0020D0B1D4|nr:uncharacterized protein LOC125832791 [Solanum verrucosum]